MSEESALVLVAGYQDLDTARAEFQALNDRAKDKSITLRGAVLVGKGADSKPILIDTGNRLGRRGAAWGAGAGLAVGVLHFVFAATGFGCWHRRIRWLGLKSPRLVPAWP
jgi:arylsulfatase